MSNNSGNCIFNGFSLSHPKCPLHLRFLAYCIDLGIVGVFFYALFFIGFIVFAFIFGLISTLVDSKSIIEILSAILIGIAIIFVLLTYSAYFIYYEYKKGETLGKKLLGLKVISIDGNKLSLKQCVVRDLLRIVDVALFIPGLISMIISKENKRLGDLAAGTMVIYVERNAKENDYLYIKQDEYNLFYQKLEPIKPEDKVVDEYLPFALQYFIQKIENEKDFTKWSSVIRNYYSKPIKDKIDDETALLFFAEFCNQQNHLKRNKENLSIKKENKNGTDSTFRQ